MSAIKPLKLNSSTGDYADFQSGDYINPAQGGLGTATAPSAVGQVPIATSGNVYAAATLTAGTGIGISNSSGSITISNTSSGLTINPTPYTSSPLTLVGTEANVLTINVNSGNFTVNLPTAATKQGLIYYFNIYDSSNTGNTLTVAANGTDKLEVGISSGYSSIVFAGTETPLGLISDGTSKWYLLTSSYMTQANANPSSFIFVGATGQLEYFSFPIGVAEGGTGQNTLSSHAVLVGEGATAVAQVSPSSTSGVALVSQGSSSDPHFGALNLTASGAITNALPAGNGGTGYSNTSGSGHVLIGNSTNGYQDGQIGSSDNTITWTEGAGTLTGQVDQANLTLSSIGGSLNLTSQAGSSILPIANGGTDLSTTPANGKLLIGNGTNYSLNHLIASTNQGIINGSGSIKLFTIDPVTCTFAGAV